tara:strand:+ start:77 stop:565 length:489 start_codon:yes stop_codon:yes gene_type:complete
MERSKRDHNKKKAKWINARKKNPALRLIDSIEIESIYRNIEKAYEAANLHHQSFCKIKKIDIHDYVLGCCSLEGDISMAAEYIAQLLKFQNVNRDWTRLRPNMIYDLQMIHHIFEKTFIAKDFKLVTTPNTSYESDQIIKNFKNEYYENMFILDQIERDLHK